MTCKNCGQELTNNTVTCPFCETATGISPSNATPAKYKDTKKKVSKKTIVIVAVVLVLAITALSVSAALTGFFGR